MIKRYGYKIEVYGGEYHFVEVGRDGKDYHYASNKDWRELKKDMLERTNQVSTKKVEKIFNKFLCLEEIEKL